MYVEIPVDLCMISINASWYYGSIRLWIKVVENTYLYSTVALARIILSMRLIDLLDKSVGDRDHLATSRHDVATWSFFERICL